MRSTFCSVAASLTVWLCGCEDAVEPIGRGGGGAGGAPAEGGAAQGGDEGGGGAPPSAWSPCPLYVDQPDGPQAECATFPVPLRWDDPSGPTIGIFVQRLLGAGPAHAQVWLLEGGPGGSGADFDEWMDALHQSNPTLDLYAIDHRGVGRSARLGCGAQETATSEWGSSVSSSEAASCRDDVVQQWGSDLGEFTTTGAARDLGYLIDLNRSPDRSVLIYSVSYGTYWAHRYLQLFPDQADGVVLDSIAPPGIDFATYDSDFDRVGHDFMDLCAADPLCAEKLGPDPWAALTTLSGDLAAGHCAPIQQAWGLDASALPTVLAVLLMSPLTRTYLPATIYRLQRCDSEDVAAIDQLLTLLFGDTSESYYDTLSSDALFYNVALSELWPEAHPDFDEVQAHEATLQISTGLTPRVAAVQDVWPAYPDDAYVGAWAETSTPILMVNGDLDPMTPLWLAQEAEARFTGPDQRFITIPRAAHCVSAQTPAAPGEEMCGLTIVKSFLMGPKEPLDTSCLEHVPEESFSGDPDLNQLVLGTTDLWENSASIAPHAPPSPRALHRLREVKRWIRAHRH